MTTSKPPAVRRGAARLAALHALAGGVTYEEAGLLHNVTRQAVAQAIRRLARAPRKPGRRPGKKRPYRVSVRLSGGGHVHVRASDGELAAWTAAAGATPLRTWLRELAESSRPRKGERAADWMRRIAAASALQAG